MLITICPIVLLRRLIQMKPEINSNRINANRIIVEETFGTTEYEYEGKTYELVKSKDACACDGCSFFNRNNELECYFLDSEIEDTPACSFDKIFVEKKNTIYTKPIKIIPIQLAPAGNTVTNQGSKQDKDKLRFDLVPANALQQVVQVITYGESKYPSIESEDGTLVQNYKLLRNAEKRLYAAVQRHLWAWKTGEVHDSETGINHLAHACSSLLFMLDLAEGKTRKGTE